VQYKELVANRCRNAVHNPTMAEHSSWLIAVVHASARSEVMFTAEFPTLPSPGTLLSYPDYWTDPKFVVVKAYIEVPDVKGGFPFVRKAFLEVRELSLDEDFPEAFPQPTS